MTKETPWGDIPAAIENTLRDFGPLTLPEIILHVPGTPNDVRKALQRMIQPNRQRHPVGQRRAHVSGWTRDAEGVRPYPRAIYALGHGENKPKPKAKPRRDVVRDWYARSTRRTTHNFVFNLGLPR